MGTTVAAVEEELVDDRLVFGDELFDDGDEVGGGLVLGESRV